MRLGGLARRLDPNSRQTVQKLPFGGYGQMAKELVSDFLLWISPHPARAGGTPASPGSLQAGKIRRWSPSADREARLPDMTRSTRKPWIPIAALSLALAAAVTAQEPAAETKKPLVTVEAVTVEPSSPGPDTLCRLRVTLRNAGEKTASLLGFAVEVAGHELPIYEKELYAFPVPPGETAELRLFNFWSSETGREAPEDGRLTVEVTLKEAQWVKIETVEDVETWTPLGAVPGLPSSADLTLKMSK